MQCHIRFEPKLKKYIARSIKICTFSLVDKIEILSHNVEQLLYKIRNSSFLSLLYFVCLSTHNNLGTMKMGGLMRLGLGPSLFIQTIVLSISSISSHPFLLLTSPPSIQDKPTCWQGIPHTPTPVFNGWLKCEDGRDGQ